MDSDFDDVLSANARWAERFEGAQLPGRAARGLAVVTCMDSRVDPLAMLGLARGDAKVLRNAGARVTGDVLRNLAVGAALLGVERVLVVPHTDCGMTRADDPAVQQAVQERTGTDARSLDFATVPDQRAALERDVQRVRSWPWLPPLPVAGALYDVTTGRLEVVVPAAARPAE